MHSNGIWIDVLDVGTA